MSEAWSSRRRAEWVVDLAPSVAIGILISSAKERECSLLPRGRIRILNSCPILSMSAPLDTPTHERVALVTGGHRGIGAGLSRALARAGHRLAVTYHQREDEAVRFVTQLGSETGVDCVAIHLDQDSLKSVERAVDATEEHLGPVDVLVNNAGIAQEVPFLELTDADWEAMLSVNLMGPVRLARRVLPAMLERRFGRIVNVSSIGGQWGGKNQLHYAASKAALINFTRSLANLYSAHDVTSNVLAPGLIATEMSAAELGTEAGRQKVRGIPAGRLGTVEEAGELVAFLASDAAGYLTGQTFNLNGGMLYAT